jgi:hypothetical protein
MLVTYLVTSSDHYFVMYLVLRYEISTAVKIQVKVFWVVMLSSIVVGYQSFGGPPHSENGGSMVL